jgi:PAS domain S-box-containing protein
MRQVLRTQVPFIGTETPATMLRHGQLQTTYYNFVYQPLYDTAGQLLGVIDVATEVTEQVLARRQVEQLNQELEARVQQRTQQLAAAQAAAEHERAQLQAVFAQAPVAIALFAGDELRITAANAAIATLWGSTPEQVVGRTLLEALPDQQGQGFDELLRQVLHTQEPFIGTEMPALLRREGQLHTTYFNFVYQPLYEADGQVASVLCIAVDVTAQVLARRQVEQLNQELEARVQERAQQAEAARAEAEVQRQRFHDLLMQLPTHVAVHEGPDQVFTLVNPGYQSLAPGRALLGLPIREAGPELATQGILDVLSGVYQTGEPFIATELPVQADFTRTGRLEQVYYNFFFLALRDAQGRINGVLNFSYDVTASVLARQQVQDLNEELAAINEEVSATNEELNESNTQLTRTNVDLDNFIYTASHDLKAPITNIEGLLLALEHELPADQRPGDVPLMLNLMQDAVERFRRTITHLTDLSRLQKEHNPDSGTVALAPVVEAVRLDLTPLLAHTQGRLLVTIPEGLTVTFAEKNLRSVVYNLLSNAFKYHHPDRLPEVRLRSWPTHDAIILEVQDNGLGLDLAQGQEKLFAMFQRLHTHVEGMGVGLYMVKRILENAGGRIEVSSELGQGSTFRVYFRR